MKLWPYLLILYSFSLYGYPDSRKKNSPLFYKLTVITIPTSPTLWELCNETISNHPVATSITVTFLCATLLNYLQRKGTFFHNLFPYFYENTTTISPKHKPFPDTSKTPIAPHQTLTINISTPLPSSSTPQTVETCSKLTPKEKYVATNRIGKLKGQGSKKERSPTHKILTSASTL
ncbi:MAG: hypothetical protein WBQ73_04290 [Candidatus Babeliales bacterium]